MTLLKQRMLDDLCIRNYSPSTVEPRDLRVERNSAVLVFPLLTLVPLPLDFVRPQPLENQSRQPDIHLLAPAQEPSLKIEFVSAASPERELQELNLLCWQPSGPFDSKHEDHFRTD